MRNGSYVLDHGDFQPGRLQCADCRFTALAGTLHVDFHRLEPAVLHSGLGSGFRNHLSRVRSGLSGTAEAEAASTCPGQSITAFIRKRNDRIVECRADMRYTKFYVLAVLFLRTN